MRCRLKCGRRFLNVIKFKSLSSIAKRVTRMDTSCRVSVAVDVRLYFPCNFYDRMKRSEQEHREDLSYLRAKLAQPEPEIDAWLNGIVDAWIATRKTKRSRTKHV